MCEHNHSHCVGLQDSMSSLYDLASRIFKNSAANHKQMYLLHRTQIFWSLSKYQQLTTTLPRIELTLADTFTVFIIFDLDLLTFISDLTVAILVGFCQHFIHVLCRQLGANPN